jgi:hypothetical protein
MIDAYTIGITLALDNGVSEGLATIRRDLIALNGVVEGSATRLTHLARAAADLQFYPSVVEQISKGQTPPARRHDDGTLPLPTDWSQLNAGLFGLGRSDLPLATGTAVPTSSASAIQPSADGGTASSNQPGMISAGLRAHAPDILSSAPDTRGDRGQGAPISDFAGDGSPIQILPRAPIPGAPWDGSGNRRSMSPDTAPAQSIRADAGLPLSPLSGPNISASLAGDRPSLQPWQQRNAGSKTDFSQDSRGAPYGTTTWAQPPSSESMLPSAVPPSTEPQSTALQGDIYVDGSRLGRWMTDRLVKAADMPRAATTGFDPRMTATWPGAPISV